MAKTPGAKQDHQTGEGADTTEALKERVSPAAQVWLDLITDVIVEEVLKENRAKCEHIQTQVDELGKTQARLEKSQQPGGPLRDDRGQKVVKPKGRLLTVQEAADYLGMSRASLAGRGWRVKNRLPAIKIGQAVRFDIQMLDRWIERHRERFPRLLAGEDGKGRTP
jgi:excisionase family DNA binding protein